MNQELITVLLQQLFGAEQAGGETISVTFHMTSPTHCADIRRYSTCGGDETVVRFDPPIPLEFALLHARAYNEKGSYTHQE